MDNDESPPEEEKADVELEEASDFHHIRRAILRAAQWRTKDNARMRAILRDVVRGAAESTLRVYADKKPVALGTIVGAEGWVVTKASPLRGAISCRLSDERIVDAEIAHTSGDFDLALLKIDAGALKAIALDPISEPPVGSWLASVGRNSVPIGIGIVSVGARPIPHQFGVLGVALSTVSPQVTQVFPESGAETAGVLINDLIVKVNEESVLTREELVKTIRTHNPGDEIELTIQREGKTLALKAVLSAEFPGITSRMDFQNNLGGKLSVRRFGFPRALQHDTVVRPMDCGGPVVNLDGNVVGINIARSGRTETFALTLDEVAKLVRPWMGSNQDVHATQGVHEEVSVEASP